MLKILQGKLTPKAVDFGVDCNLISHSFFFFTLGACMRYKKKNLMKLIKNWVLTLLYTFSPLCAVVAACVAAVALTCAFDKVEQVQDFTNHPVVFFGYIYIVTELFNRCYYILHFVILSWYCSLIVCIMKEDQPKT